jgi:outer membrane lipoprotein-sorting protein
MKKAFVIIGMLFVLPVFAANPAQEALKRMAARIDALGDYQAAFEVRAEGNVVAGTYAVSGDRYYMHTAEYDVMSDGRTRWEVNHADKEVSVDAVDLRAGNILTNPTRAFDFAPEAFVSTIRGENVVLTPRDGASAVRSIEVVTSPATGLPAEVRYRQEGLQGEVVVRIVSLKKGLPAGAAFTLDKTKFSGYEVLDFR